MRYEIHLGQAQERRQHRKAWTGFRRRLQSLWISNADWH